MTPTPQKPAVRNLKNGIQKPQEISTPSVDEDGYNFIGHEYNINRATLINLANSNIQSSTTSIRLNADEMLSILPDKITTSLNVYLNPNGLILCVY